MISLSMLSTISMFSKTVWLVSLVSKYDEFVRYFNSFFDFSRGHKMTRLYLLSVLCSINSKK